MPESICLAVKPHQRGDILPPICAQPYGHQGKHRSSQYVFVMTGPSQPYEW